MRRKRFGKNGEDLIIKVPVGTVILDDLTDRVMADMDQAGETRLLLKGGKAEQGREAP